MKSRDKPPSTRSFSQKLKSFLYGMLPTQRAETRADLLENLKHAEEDGIVARDAYDMMQRVMYVSDLKVRDIMIPRSSMVSIKRDDSFDECLDAMVESGHSRFPVVDEERDQIVGTLLAKDLLMFFDNENRPRFNLRDLTRPVVFVPESKRLNVLLSDFRENRNHMAVVVDEFSNVAGLVTIEDVLEQIVGDIEDEHDVEEDEHLIRVLDDGETIVKALLPVEEFNEYFKAYLHDNGSDTIGGLISQQLGHVPQRDEVVVIDGFRFEIVHADTRRVYLIRVSNQNAQT